MAWTSKEIRKELMGGFQSSKSRGKRSFTQRRSSDNERPVKTLDEMTPAELKQWLKRGSL